MGYNLIITLVTGSINHDVVIVSFLVHMHSLYAGHEGIRLAQYVVCDVS